MAAEIPYSVATNIRSFLAGIAIEEARVATSKERAADKINGFIRVSERDLREVYDRLIPNILVADSLQLTNIIINRMTKNPEIFLDDVGVNNLLKFQDTNSTEYRGLFTVIDSKLKEYHTRLLGSQAGVTNPVRELNSLSEKLFNRTRKIDNDISARVLGMEFSANIRKIFGNKSILAAVMPELTNKPTAYIFFSSSFESIGAAIRENVYGHIESYLKDTIGPLDFPSKFKTGSVANLGHAALVNDLGVYANTPAFAKTLFGVSKGFSKRFTPTQVSEAAEYFKTESKIYENSIEVTKEFTGSSGGYSVLLSLGVTFTNFEDSAINTVRGSTFERGAINRVGIDKPIPLTTTQKNKLFRTLISRVFRNNPALAKSSRSIAEFVLDAIKGEISGNKTKGESSKVKITSKITRKTVVSNKNKKPVVFKTPRPAQTRVPLNKTAPVSVSEINLTNLQRLLDLKLADQIKQNMGTGGRRDILNLQTGRLAESAKVERLSESRQGMITAFYTYMKYPYATFSQGGRQEQPKSRDPKLLIAKSIRELAKEQVANRMRAVVV